MLYEVITASKSQARKDTRTLITDMLSLFSILKKELPEAVAETDPIVYTPGKRDLSLVFSDWHIGKVIKDPEGKYLYNSEIGIKRIQEEIPEQINNFVKSLSCLKDIENVNLLFIGDIIDNDIVYSTQRLHIDSPVAVQFKMVIFAIMTLVRKIKKIFRDNESDVKINIKYVPGNHGRSSEFSEDPGCSWDSAIGMAVDLAVQNSDLKDDVKVDISTEKYSVVNVRGFKGLIRHTAPPQAETPSAKSKFGGWNDIFNYDFVAFGHS